MAAASPTASSTKETTNYARLCRLLVDVGTQALRDTFDVIHAPANLHTVLAGNKTTLQTLRKRKIINATQWGKLFPAIPNSVSSRDFDITILMVLLRNICGLPSPVTGWDTLPAVTDVSREADIARVKYFRNTVYAHAEHASVDDATFNAYWQDIRDTLVRLGGVQYRAAIDNLETECMDPEIEDHYKELLSQWNKDEDNVKDQLNEIMTKLDALKVASDLTSDPHEDSTLKDMVTHEPVMCKEKCHENEAVIFYCQECEVCICQKCVTLNHNGHTLMGIPQAAEKEKIQMTKGFERVKAKLEVVETKIKQQVELIKKSDEEISAAENVMTETVEEIIRVAREHETAVKKELAEMKEVQKRNHETKLENFQLLATQLRNSVEYGEGVVQRDIAAEILEEGHTVFGRCEDLLNREEIKVYKPKHVTYHVNKATIDAARSLVPGHVVARQTVDPSQSVAEGTGLKEADLDTETSFTITTRDSEGKRFYDEGGQVTVKICSPTGENCETNIENGKDGIYTVSYKPDSVGLHDIVVKVNGKPLIGCPWNIEVTPHQYKVLLTFTLIGPGRGEFDSPCSIAVSGRTGNIAIAEEDNKQIQLFDCGWKHLRTIRNRWIRKRISEPTSVAFPASGDIIITHGDFAESRKMSVFSQRGQFIKHISEHLLDDPGAVFVTTDGHMIVFDDGDDKVKVLSPDGTELLKSFSAPEGDKTPWFAVYHQDRFFVSYTLAHVVKVFSKEGVFLYDIGSEGSGDGQLNEPAAIAIDKFNNLIICDTGNKRMQIFSLDGKFVNSVVLKSRLDFPASVAVTKNGHVLVCDCNSDCIFVFQ
ncbi:uncharacterized protein LOC144643898 [Oculina patagonica]